MLRILTGAVVALVLIVGNALAADAKVAKNNQMVRGTIKSADPTTSVLVVNQKVGNGVVDRELSITEKAEFVITTK
jgi:hypothetical protein